MAKDFRRLAVVKGLEKVSQSGFSNLVLPSLLEDRNLQEKDRNFVTAVFYGTLEHKITLDYILQKYIRCSPHTCHSESSSSSKNRRNIHSPSTEPRGSERGRTQVLPLK